MNITLCRTLKARLAALGKTQKDLFVELNKRGAKITTVQQLYQYTNGSCVTNKAQYVLDASFKIIAEWENMQK